MIQQKEIDWVTEKAIVAWRRAPSFGSRDRLCAGEKLMQLADHFSIWTSSSLVSLDSLSHKLSLFISLNQWHRIQTDHRDIGFGGECIISAAESVISVISPMKTSHRTRSRHCSHLLADRSTWCCCFRVRGRFLPLPYHLLMSKILCFFSVQSIRWFMGMTGAPWHRVSVCLSVFRRA